MKLVHVLAGAVALVAVSASADDAGLRQRRSDLLRSDRSGSVVGQAGVVAAPGVGDRVERDRFTYPASPEHGIAVQLEATPQRVEPGSELRDVDEISLSVPVAGIEQLTPEGYTTARFYQEAVDVISLAVELQKN